MSILGNQLLKTSRDVSDVGRVVENARANNDLADCCCDFFKLNPLPCWIYDPTTLAFIDVNEAAINHYGYTRSEFLNLTVLDIRVRETSADFEFELVESADEWSWRSGPWFHKLKNGARIEVETALRDLSDTARLVIIRDVTEQRRAQTALRYSEAKLQEAQAIARLGYWELDTYSGEVSWSAQASNMLGWNGSSDRISYQSVLAMVHKGDRKRVVSAIRRSVQRGQPYDLQFRIVRHDGQTRHIHGRGQLSSGSAHSLAGTVLDITELKQVQSELQQSLNEKEVLLREIHHRVKNNLQVISCLLNLQADSLGEGESAAQAALLDSERRVISMALIHERLYGNFRFDRVDFAPYAQTLVEDLLAIYVSDSATLARFSLQSVHLSVEQAIPCGLILNELVSNALKHACRASGEGEIAIELRSLEKGRVMLSVSDRGRGMPAEFDWRSSSSLGLTIVHLLTKQIGGSLEIVSNHPGTSFQITFQSSASGHAVKRS